MKRRLMLGGFAASLLSASAHGALAVNPLDAPLVLADRTLVGLERLELDVDPLTGEPSEASRRRLERLLAGEPRRGCVVAAQVLGRIDRAELEGRDPLEAHRRARARAERAAATLAAAGVERQRVVAAWDPSRPGDPGQMTIWLITDWSDPSCALLPSEPGPRIALAPPPAGVGVGAGAGVAGPSASPTPDVPASVGSSPAETAGAGAAAPVAAAAAVPPAPADPVRVPPSTGLAVADDHAPATRLDPPAVATMSGPRVPPAVAGATRTAAAEPAAIAAPPEPAPAPARAEHKALTARATPRSPRPDTLAAPVGRIASLLGADSATSAAPGGNRPPASVVDTGVTPLALPASTVAADEMARPPAASLPSSAVVAPASARGSATLALVEGRAGSAIPGRAPRPVTTSGTGAAPPPPPLPASGAAARSEPPTRPHEQRTTAASAALPADPPGERRRMAPALEPAPAATSRAIPGTPTMLPEPAAGGIDHALSFQFPTNSSILDATQKRQLEALVRRLPTDRPVRLRLTVAVGSGDVTGADDATARRYNRWLAQRRAARVERWLRHYAGERQVALETSLHDNDPSRTARLTLVAAP